MGIVIEAGGMGAGVGAGEGNVGVLRWCLRAAGSRASELDAVRHLPARPLWVVSQSARTISGDRVNGFWIGPAGRRDASNGWFRVAAGWRKQ